MVLAQQVIKQRADKLNYFTGSNHIVYVQNTGTNNTYLNITIPIGFVASSSSSQCGLRNASLVECNLTASTGNGTYTVFSNGTLNEYTITNLTCRTNNTQTCNGVAFVRIHPSEIWHTLVEFGRGRGNYFFDTTQGLNKSGSGRSAEGCTFLPNETLFELNFLHKVQNPRQYYGVPTGKMENATFTCVYPNRTFVRFHFAASIERTSQFTNITYTIPEISTSFERTAFLGMDFDSIEQKTGDQLPITCSNFVADFTTVGGGNFTITNDSFQFAVRSRNPFVINASVAPGTSIGNGTQEVLITYNITNKELHTVENVEIELPAPANAQFIGLRGELFGVGTEMYRIEKNTFLAGESHVISLLARFETNSSLAIDPGNFSFSRTAANIRFIPCWEAQGYNPQEYVQLVGIGGTINSNLSVASSVTSIFGRINEIFNLVVSINNTVSNTNSVVNSIQTTVNNINSTVNAILDNVTLIKANTESILDRIVSMQEFDEEIVFLVTDAFGLQQQARQELAGGNSDSAIQRLREANHRLEEAAAKMVVQQTALTTQGQPTAPADDSWVMTTVLLIAIFSAGIFIIAKRPEK
ncbi:hypothetical protein HY639_02520 [Candidatus Woesearchaeota archaeon]|nr:hypothetical protein [Candidatus Woesearchaeota archaeon]